MGLIGKSCPCAYLCADLPEVVRKMDFLLALDHHQGMTLTLCLTCPVGQDTEFLPAGTVNVAAQTSD